MCTCAHVRICAHMDVRAFVLGASFVLLHRGYGGQASDELRILPSDSLRTGSGSMTCQFDSMSVHELG